jgi:NDP-sugar pyrophosphorylase family protein
MSKFLSALKSRNSELLAPEGTGIVGPVLIDPTAKIGKDCLIGPNVVIGPGAVIEDGARIKRSTVMADCRVRANAWIHNSIIGKCYLRTCHVTDGAAQVGAARWVGGHVSTMSACWVATSPSTTSCS